MYNDFKGGVERLSVETPSHNRSAQASHCKVKALIAAWKGLTYLGSSKMECVHGKSKGETVSQLSHIPTAVSWKHLVLASCKELQRTTLARPMFTSTQAMQRALRIEVFWDACLAHPPLFPPRPPSSRLASDSQRRDQENLHNASIPLAAFVAWRLRPCQQHPPSSLPPRWGKVPVDWLRQFHQLPGC